MKNIIRHCYRQYNLLSRIIRGSDYYGILTNRSIIDIIKFRIVANNSRSSIFIVRSFLKLFKFILIECKSKRIATLLSIIIAYFFIFSQLLCATSNLPSNQNIEFESEKQILEKTLFPKKDSIVSTQTCQFSCREVEKGYKTQITNIDVASGTTVCSVFSDFDLSHSLGINANQINKTCRKQANPSYTGKISSTYKKYPYDSRNLKSNKITFSRFLASMVTLDPEIIDFKTTHNTGILTLKNPSAIYGTNTTINQNDATDWRALFGVKVDSPELVASADSINKTNLAYYVDLFSSFNKYYSQIQNLLFIMIGGYFLALMGGKKILNYLQQNNQQDKDYLKHFVIPAVASAIFFVPIPESGGMNSTIIQNFIRYSTTTSIKIADDMSKVGTEVYMRKIFNSVGSQIASEEKEIRNIYERAKVQTQMYEEVLNYCKKAYPNKMSFMQYYGDSTLSYDLNNQAGSDRAITQRGCANIERSWLEKKTQESQYKHYISIIEGSFENGELQILLNNLNKGLNNRQSELGWINATLVPSAGIMVETLALVKKNQLQDTEDNAQKVEDSRLKTAKNAQSVIGEAFGWGLGNTVYLMLPGAGSVYKFLSDALKLDGTASFLLSFSGIGWIIKGVLGTMGPIASLAATVYIYQKILEILPLLTMTVASIGAFIIYIVSLAKYYYVSPFVVAFSLTTKSTHKITEFLVTGIAIFMRPILIVLFIFFTLFIYHLITDVFMDFVITQFTLLNELNNEFMMGIIIGIIKGIMKILGMIASLYICYKLIWKGPSLLMKMVGIEDKGDSITDSLSQKLDKYSFQL